MLRPPLGPAVSWSERAPALQPDVLALVIAAHVALLEARMQFDLIDGRRYPRGGDDPVDMGRVKIGDAD